MKKKIFLIAGVFLLLIEANSLFAQKLQVKWGHAEKRGRGKHNIQLGFVGKNDHYFYTLRKVRREMFLSQYDNVTMDKKWEKEISWNDFNRDNSSDRNLTYYSFRQFKDHFTFYFEDYNKPLDQQKLFAQNLNFEGEPIGELYEVANREKQRRRKDGSFLLTHSTDSIHSAVIINPYFEKYENELFEINLLDADQKIINKVKVPLPFHDEDLALWDYELIGKDDLYLLVRLEKKKKEREDGEPENVYSVVHVNMAAGSTDLIEIPFREHYADVIELLADANGKIKCSGLYGNLKPNGKVATAGQGVFYFDPTQPSQISYKEFDPILVAEIAGRRKAKKGKGAGGNLDFRYSFKREDGGLILMFEHSFSYIVTHRTSTGATYSTTYYEDHSIIKIDVSKGGVIEGYQSVPKKQITQNEAFIYASFYALYYEGNTYIVYNDHVKNIERNSYDKTMNNVFNAIPVLVIIDKQGNVTKKPMIGKGTKTKFVLKPALTDKAAENQAYFYADKLSKGFLFFGRGKTKWHKIGVLTVN